MKAKVNASKPTKNMCHEHKVECFEFCTQHKLTCTGHHEGNITCYAYLAQRCSAKYERVISENSVRNNMQKNGGWYIAYHVLQKKIDKRAAEGETYLKLNNRKGRNLTPCVETCAYNFFAVKATSLSFMNHRSMNICLVLSF